MAAKPRPLTSGAAGGGGGNKGRIVWTEDSLTENIEAFPGKLDRVIGLMMQYQAPKVQDYMRTNASWNDRTGNARNGLFARYGSGGGKLFGAPMVGGAGGNMGEHVIDIYHTVPYGIWLEVRWSGKYRIIVPTLQSEGPRVMAALSKAIGKMH